MNWLGRFFLPLVRAVASWATAFQERHTITEAPILVQPEPEPVIVLEVPEETETPEETGTSPLDYVAAGAGAVWDVVAWPYTKLRGRAAEDDTEALGVVATEMDEAPVPVAEALVPEAVVHAAPESVSATHILQVSDWGEVSIHGDRSAAIERVCRRCALSAANKTMSGSAMPSQVLCFEVAHEVALLNGRTTLLDFSVTDLVRACNEALEGLKPYGIADVSLDKLLGALSTLEDVRQANEMLYFSKVGTTVLSAMGGLTVMNVTKLAYHLGAPRLLGPQRARDAAIVYFTGKVANHLYMAR